MACGGLPIGAVTFQQEIDFNAGGLVTVLPAVAGKTYYITDMVFSTSVAMDFIEFRDTTATTILDLFMPASSVWSKTWCTPINVGLGNGFQIVTPTPGDVSMTVTGYIK
jgi:hypothetical protein